MELGELEKVDIREYWEDEARNFTPWLAQDTNIQKLAETIDIGNLEVDDTETYIGSNRADIIAEDPDGKKVLIENQLSRTDHKHLGQIIAYASGIEAEIIIWICEEVSDEHRKAIDWLNEITGPDISFFACEIELWKIGESKAAPKFNVIASPNYWSKYVKSEVSSKTITPAKILHLEFWTSFSDFLKEGGTNLGIRKPRPQPWYSFAVGRSKFHIAVVNDTQSKKVRCELYMRGKQAKTSFHLLETQKDEIENELGELSWQELPDKQDCRIAIYKDADISKKEEWPEIQRWHKEKAEAFYETFSPRVKGLDLNRAEEM